MDRLYEMFTWLMFAAFGCWFAANKTTPAGGQSAPEAAPAARPTIPEATDALSDRIEKSRIMASCEGSIVAFGLSDMLKRQKVRRNLKRRKEDQAS